MSLLVTATPRQFTEVVHDRPDYEALSMGRTGPPSPPLLGSNFEHVTHNQDMPVTKFTSPSQVVPSDLPSWTPLRTLGNDEGSSASGPEVDELSINTLATNDLTTKRLGELPTNTQATAKNTTTAGHTLKSSSDAKPSKTKKARFDGVLITTKCPPRHKKYRSQAQSRPAPAAGAQVLSLVDALTRTFDANRHTEDPFSRRSRTGSLRHDDASTAPQTDVETTEAEDEQLQLNTRLARTTLKKRHTRATTTNASETNSEDVTSLLQDKPPPDRPVKRLKPIQYESNPTLIDAALGTVQAPISWDAELDIITRDSGEDIVSPVQTVHVPSGGDRMSVDEGVGTADSPGTGSNSPSTTVRNEWRVPTWRHLKRAILIPYVSRGTQFRQRLAAIFGENATVRTDRVARPRPAEFDFFAPPDEPDRVPSPITCPSTVSVSSASTTEEGGSAIPSTQITSQSPDIPPPDTNGDQLLRNQLDGVNSLTKPTFDAGGEQMHGWITAVQRLVKGKVHVKDEELETLSIILAEIESVKDRLNEDVPMITELSESLKQLSELPEIPFGDRNKLRQRAENIFRTWPSLRKLGAS